MIFTKYIQEESSPKEPAKLTTGAIEFLLSKVADDNITDVSELKILLLQNKNLCVSAGVLGQQLSQFKEIVLLCEKIIRRQAVKTGQRNTETGEWDSIGEYYPVPLTEEKLKEVAWEITLRDFSLYFETLTDVELSGLQVQFNMVIDKIISINKDFATYKNAVKI